MSDARYGIGLGNDWSDERRRLAGAEALFDPGTFRHLDAIGVKSGMRCLEIGGGGGSAARFMADRVGSEGSVLVTDIDIGNLQGCDRPNIEVLVHDIVNDALDEDGFDIIHARLVLEHLPVRLKVLDKLVAALRPNGWLLIEDFDFSPWMHIEDSSSLLCEPSWVQGPLRASIRGSAALGAGWDGEFGRDLPLHMVNAGLHNVNAEASTPLVVGGSVGADFLTVSIRQIGSVLVDAGFVEQSDLDAAMAAFEKPGSMILFFTMVSAWGQHG